MSGAFFGKPQPGVVAGGFHVSVHVVPVFDGRLVVFDITAPAARGRWLPWTVAPFGANPWQIAAELADDWLQGAIEDLSLADVLSYEVPGGGWELAIVFRAKLTALPREEPDRERAPVLFERGAFDAIGTFAPVDLERWVNDRLVAGNASARGGGGNLLF